VFETKPIDDIATKIKTDNGKNSSRITPINEKAQALKA